MTEATIAAHVCATCHKGFDWEADVIDDREFCSFHCGVTFTPEVPAQAPAQVIPLFPVAAAATPEPEPEPPAPIAAAAAVESPATSPEQPAQIAPEPAVDNASLAAVVGELEQEWAEQQSALPALAAMDDESIVVLGGDIESMIASIKQRHADELAEHLEQRAAVHAEIERRVLANLSEEQIREQTGKSTFKLAVPGFDCGIEITRNTAKFIDVLRGLESLVTPEEFSKAVVQEKMPKPEDLPWTANMTQLKSLVKKYGDKSQVAEIVRKGTAYRESSRRVFLKPIDPPQKNVAPGVAA